VLGLSAAIRPNMNRLFHLLFGAETNTKQVFSTALVKDTEFAVISLTGM